MELISIIVPIYKVEAYLNQCIESIVNQTYKNLEIILVNDGSPDCSLQICKEWKQKDGRIVIINKKNGGLSDARNAGINAAKGSYIGFVDGDDWIAPEMYERLYNTLIKDQSDIAACNVEMVWEDGKRSMLTHNKPQILGSKEAQKALLDENNIKHPVWYKIYKRNQIQNIFFEKGKCHEDVFWTYRALGVTNRISIIEYTGYYYRQRDNSIMGTGYSVRRLDVIEAYMNRIRYFHNVFPELENDAVIDLKKKCIYHGQMAMKYLKDNERKKALSYLSYVMKEYPLDKVYYNNIKYTHRIWIKMADISLPVVCFIKMVLNIGF